MWRDDFPARLDHFGEVVACPRHVRTDESRTAGSSEQTNALTTNSARHRPTRLERTGSSVLTLLDTKTVELLPVDERQSNVRVRHGTGKAS
ncbi:MAG: hypothetical protein WCP03_03200, partial [Candidatus Saccharibacteria bacterium]